MWGLACFFVGVGGVSGLILSGVCGIGVVGGMKCRRGVGV